MLQPGAESRTPQWCQTTNPEKLSKRRSWRRGGDPRDAGVAGLAHTTAWPGAEGWSSCNQVVEQAHPAMEALRRHRPVPQGRRQRACALGEGRRQHVVNGPMGQGNRNEAGSNRAVAETLKEANSALPGVQCQLLISTLASKRFRDAEVLAACLRLQLFARKGESQWLSQNGRPQGNRLPIIR